MNRLTGLKDSYGTEIREGDTIIWTYVSSGIMHNDEFIGCMPGNITKELQKEQKVEYEIREDAAGFFLDIPYSMGVYGHHDTIRCKVKQ